MRRKRRGGGYRGALSSLSVCVFVCVGHPVGSELRALLFQTGEGLRADRPLPLLSLPHSEWVQLETGICFCF